MQMGVPPWLCSERTRGALNGGRLTVNGRKEKTKRGLSIKGMAMGQGHWGGAQQGQS